MAVPSVFDQLCDLTDDLQRLVRDLPFSATKLALEVLVHRADSLIDQTVGLERVPPLDDAEEETHAPRP
jgi:hypothetical protein